MDPQHPTPEPQNPDTTRETPSREARPESRPLTDNERHAGKEQSDKVRRSNLAGDQDVAGSDTDDTDR